MRARYLSLGIALLAATAVACGSSSKPSAAPSSSASAGGSLTVASAGFTESRVLAAMYAIVLQKAGYKVTTTDVASSEVLEPALEKGQIDVVPEYVATYANVLDAQINHKQAGDVASPSLSASYAALQSLTAKVGLVALTPSSAVDQNAFAVTKSFAAQHHLTTLSDLGASGIAVRIAGPSECATRPFCAPGLERVYHIKVSGIDPLGFDSVEGKKAVQDGHDQVAEVATTDATVGSFNLVVLTDDKHLQNADNLVPIVYGKVNNPTIEKALNQLSAVLTTTDLGQLDAAVDVQRQTPQQAAQAYLSSKGLA